MLWKIRTFSTNEKLRFLLTWIVLDFSFYLLFLLRIFVFPEFIIFWIIFLLISLSFIFLYLAFSFRDQKSVSQWMIYIFGIIFLGVTINLVFFTPMYPNRDSVGSHTKIRLNYIGRLLTQFKEECSRYPLTEEGLGITFEKDKAHGCETNPAKGFVLGEENDEFPWGQKYTYSSDGTNYELRAITNKRVFYKTDKLQAREIK